MGEMMKVVVFQEQGSGERKLAGLKHYGQRLEIVRVVDIDGPLPDFIDEPEEWIGDEVDLGGGELVLNFLKHPDLVDHLIAHCEKRHIPIVSAGARGVDLPLLPVVDWGAMNNWVSTGASLACPNTGSGWMRG